MAAFGTLPDGREIEVFHLVSDQLSVNISNYGARIISVIKDDRDLVYGPKTAEELINDSCYCGAVCGRVANRIAKGHFSLDGSTRQLAVNNPPNHLHGGNVGFDQKIWQIQDHSNSRIILTLTSPDGDENYPGTLEVVATYTLIGSTLELLIEAYTTDEPTIVNLTNHVYWNLSGEETIDHHSLELRSTAYTPKDATGIPDGRILPVTDTPFDLSKPKLLKNCNSPSYPETESGFDHNFVLPTGEESQIAAILHCPSNGLKLIVATNSPGLQVYTGEYLPRTRGGIALEAQDFPNSINIPHFPSIVLRPGRSSVRLIAWTII